ncbi:MAG: hypothetical protein HKN47_09010, partial [Pirellulaceae bacterium]|nr:hypothetical protein [Pirellulaceae bacterium]
MNQFFRCATTLILLAAIAATSSQLQAQSALELLSGFDAARIEAAYPPGDSESFGELAKIIYRLKRVSDDGIESKIAAETTPLELGDAIRVTGTIKSLRTLKVPDNLVEFLEFPVFQDIVISVATEDAEASDEPTSHEAASHEATYNTKTLNLIAARLPTGAAVGDRIEAVGVVIEENADSESSFPLAMASGHVKWFPSQPPSNGWRLLSQAGVDVSELADVGDRNRQPLMAADNDAFYQMLAVSQQIADTPLAAQLEPTWIVPVDLLREPKKFTGDWLRMQLRTVRVTRIAVTDPERQKQLGSDHYFQIDANGDLGNVVVQIARPDGETGEPVRFEGMYPVSLVMKELPGFLSKAIQEQEGGDAVVALISKPIQVEGFFFRLWSYSSDYMERQNAGDQFGPLLMVARMNDRSSVGTGGVGVEVIGYVAAFVIVGGILATLIWSRVNSGEDL